MRSTLDTAFLSTYKPLLEKFMNDIKGVNPTSLPVPFLPYYGVDYEKSPYKIAFVGWETRSSTNLSKYINEYNNQSEEVYYWFRDDLDEPFNFLKREYGYMFNFGTDFWSFVLKFLSRFYDINDWKEIKKKKHPEILKSFVWGNVCSIESYNASNRIDARIEDYNKVKSASEIFDHFNLLLNVFKPNIVIVLYKRVPKEWLVNGISDCSEPEEINEDLLWHYYIKDTNTHIYHTHHPGSLSRRKINFVSFISKILQDIKQKKIFENFPGERLLEI